jgi:uncharacterized membrane protein YeaQ/YmgE (transglycosylase-associated protein family)
MSFSAVNRNPQRYFVSETVAFAGALGGRCGTAHQRGGKEGSSMPERSILGWLLIGLVAGVLGKFVMPGKDPGGFIVTILIGIAGALLAGFVAQTMNWTLVGGWQNYAAATAGAIVLLALYRLVVNRRV